MGVYREFTSEYMNIYQEIFEWNRIIFVQAYTKGRNLKFPFFRGLSIIVFGLKYPSRNISMDKVIIVQKEKKGRQFPFFRELLYRIFGIKYLSTNFFTEDNDFYVTT